MTHRYTIGGVAFIVDQPLPDLETHGFADGTVRVHFVDTQAFRSLDTPGRRRVDGQMGLSGVIEPDSMTCWLPDRHEDAVDRSWQLRQMAPIFSAVLSRLVLHASAAEMHGGVIAFVGESGAGKSTLASFLADLGYRQVADDLLPIRFRPEPWAPTEERILPVRTICLLDRSETSAVVVEPVTAIHALQSLIRHGFGEHGDQASWGFQFDAYHRLVKAVPVFDLAIPDSIMALDRVAEALVGGSMLHSVSADTGDD